MPAGSAATGKSNLIAGGIFWGVASMVVFGIAGYWRAVGTKRFFEDMGSDDVLLMTNGPA